MFYERAKELIDNATKISDPINKTLMHEFGLRSDEVSRRIKSYFGKNIRDLLKEKLLPSREEIEDALVKSNNVNEMKKLLGFSKTSVHWKGLLDREFGYSTYKKAKANYILKRNVQDYNPTIADNKSILISQYLGDGSFDIKRSALKIEHGYKQLEYLKFKVSLINKAFPTTNDLNKIKLRIHDNGYKSYTWYSKSISYIPKIYEKPKEKLIHELTPLGWLLYYLDDGFLSIGNVYSCGFSTIDPDIQKSIVATLETYGINGWNYTRSDVRLQNQISIAYFLNNIIYPFKNIIPECMNYKLDMKI